MPTPSWNNYCLLARRMGIVVRQRLTQDTIDLIIDEMLNIWSDSEHWAQGALAYNEHDDEVSVADPTALKWCAVGCKALAIRRLNLHGCGEEFEAFMDNYASNEHDAPSVVAYNDDTHTTFEDMRLFVKTLKDKPWVDAM